MQDCPDERPPLPETPGDALGELIQDRVRIGDRKFLLERPADLDTLLDHPTTQAAFDRDEYMPYWADLWPAARMLAKVVLAEPWTPGLRALELGCGLGLAGLAALACGLHVTFSDYDAMAVRFAARNAQLNGFTEFDTLQLDWRYPPEGLQASVILAADLVYEVRNVAPVVSLIKRVLAPGGVCLLTDADRVPAQALRELLTAEGLTYTTKTLRISEASARNTGDRRYKGTLYRIGHGDG